jgi:hypothetical protein
MSSTHPISPISPIGPIRFATPARPIVPVRSRLARGSLPESKRWGRSWAFLQIQSQLIRFYPAERFCVQLHMVLI